jgi:EAL domain-containing protein (putative c-di-GMP-specific phosphodiesterase class I)
MEEGVEAAEQHAFLNVQACQALQGLLLDRH